MTGSVAGRQERCHAGRDLDIAVGEAPVDTRIVEVDPEDCVPLGRDRIRLGCFQFLALNVNRDSAREVPETTRVIVVEVTQRNRKDISGVDTDQGERILEGVTGP